MSEPLVLVPIVEGYGEVAAVPVLLRRLVERIAPGRVLTIEQPIRVGRASVVKPGELERYVALAHSRHRGQGATLVILDADDDCPASLGPALRQRALEARPDAAVSVVLPMKEFEAWFLAAAPSLAGRRGLPGDLEAPPDPEAVRDAKGWLQERRTDGLAYGPTVDQPALTALMDLDMARSGASSFDKLWRDIERLLSEAES